MLAWILLTALSMVARSAAVTSSIPTYTSQFIHPRNPSYMVYLRWPSDKNVCIRSYRLGFDSKSGQTKNLKIGIYSSQLDAQH